MYKLVSSAVIFAVFGLVFVAAQHNHDHDHHHDHSHGNLSMNAAKECDFDAHHLHCHDPDDDSIHLCIGESIPLKGCRQMTCVHHDGDVVLIRTCHALTAKAGCHMSKQDNTKNYPDCCPQEVCP